MTGADDRIAYAEAGEPADWKPAPPTVRPIERLPDIANYQPAT